MEVVKEFSKFANEYEKHNIIQTAVVKKLCESLDKAFYENILDVGAGTGGVYEELHQKNIKFSNFVALDFSQKMLDIHHTDCNIKKLCLDFNQKKFSSVFKVHEFDLLISSSALQWSHDLSQVLQELSLLSHNFVFSFFTANTFKTLHQRANIESPILSTELIIEALNKFFIYDLELVEYQLKFDSVREMLHYIKKSGVSGGVKQLSYKQMKMLIMEYKLDYLEFEVLFVKVRSKKK